MNYDQLLIPPVNWNNVLYIADHCYPSLIFNFKNNICNNDICCNYTAIIEKFLLPCTLEDLAAALMFITTSTDIIRLVIGYLLDSSTVHFIVNLSKISSSLFTNHVPITLTFNYDTTYIYFHFFARVKYNGAAASVTNTISYMRINLQYISKTNRSNNFQFDHTFYYIPLGDSMYRYITSHASFIPLLPQIKLVEFIKDCCCIYESTKYYLTS